MFPQELISGLSPESLHSLLLQQQLLMANKAPQFGPGQGSSWNQGVNGQINKKEKSKEKLAEKGKEK